jgi:hypothetical protein
MAVSAAICGNLCCKLSCGDVYTGVDTGVEVARTEGRGAFAN